MWSSAAATGEPPVYIAAPSEVGSIRVTPTHHSVTRTGSCSGFHTSIVGARQVLVGRGSDLVVPGHGHRHRRPDRIGLRQRPGRGILRNPQMRVGRRAPSLGDRARRSPRRLPMDRLLQPPTPPLRAEPSQPRRLRTDPRTDYAAPDRGTIRCRPPGGTSAATKLDGASLTDSQPGARRPGLGCARSVSFQPERVQAVVPEVVGKPATTTVPVCQRYRTSG